MKRFLFLCHVFTISIHAQSLLPIPQLPVVPTLPLAINPDGYFVFSWSNTTVNSQSKIIATNPPVEVRSGVIGLENFATGSWFLKTNGEVFVYTRGGGSMEPNRLSMPNFFKSDIAKFYRSKGANPYYWFGISRNGQTGIMFDTNQSSFSQPSVLADVVDIYLEQPFKMMTLHAGGNLKAWDFNGGNLVSIPHPISFYSDVRAVEGTLNQGLVILGNGQVKGWKYNSGAGSYEELILPAEVSSNVVQISGPSYQSTSQISYALKTNGSLVAWDIQGQILPLPVNLSGKEFVSIRGNIESAGVIAAFALA
ncbi:MAG: hypothetical protein EB038_09395, partial [Cyclobacteriaceae bacterium]|nr:hypothetical protein [Cyclobacteriaceae bacterium]